MLHAKNYLVCAKREGHGDEHQSKALSVTGRGTLTTIVIAPAKVVPGTQPRLRLRQRLPTLDVMTWLCMTLACIGASWFSYQCFLVPQPARYVPDWQDSRWVQAADGIAPVAYFRYGTSLTAVPDNAFVTVAASQVFTLYMNDNFIGSNATDFVEGRTPQAYMYDVTSAIKSSVNVLTVRVSNLDEQTPSLRLNLGVVIGRTVSYYGTGATWQATTQSTSVYPRYTTNLRAWTRQTFDANSWPTTRNMSNIPVSPMLAVNPLVYEQPLSARWMSAGAGRDAYFVRQLSLPFGANAVWLRIAATGTATIFINGKLSVVWNGQMHSTGVSEINYLSYSEPRTQYHPGLALGTYNISPYIHAGTNTLAVYVASPGLTATRLGLGDLSAVAIVDVLAGDVWGHTTLSSAINDWHASHKAVSGWNEGSTTALAWTTPTEVGRPGSLRTFYRPNSSNLLASDNNQRGIQIVPLSYIAGILAGSVTLVLIPWLFVAQMSVPRIFLTRGNALETLSLAYLPALACEALLLALSREPQMPQPFPYTWSWGLLLLLLTGISYLLLCANSIKIYYQRFSKSSLDNAAMTAVGMTGASPVTTIYNDAKQLLRSNRQYRSDRACPRHSYTVCCYKHILAQLRIHWPVVLLFLAAIPLITYNLSYEPLWQDELSSYYTAKGILAHGLPLFPSGFVYAKAEFHSYLLALWMFIFGDSIGAARMMSVLEYLISIPLLYGVGCYFFERRIALLATAMLALSPVSLVWGRQIRMYEQAQVLTLLSVYLLFKAVQEHKRTRLIYLALSSLLLTYLSHEETFIILPALVICVLMISMNSVDDKGRVRHLPAVLYQKHWWFAALLGTVIIGIQLLIAHVTHPPVLGTDQSERPFVQFSTDNIPFYMSLLFSPTQHEAWLVLNSVLATVGCWWARRSTDKRVHYCATFLVLSFLTLVLLFTMQADRYFYPLLPIYYLMSAYAMMTSIQALWNFARIRLVLRPTEQSTSFVLGGFLTRPIQGLVILTITLLCACVLIVPILPLSGYNLFISRMVEFSYHRHYPDYDAVGQYMHQHWHEGDVVLCVSPDFTVNYYVGHADAFFSIDRALFLVEQHGHIVGTSVGGQALLNQNDLNAILDAHKRVWIISDNSLYQSLVVKRFTFPPDMHIVFEGYGSAVYLRNS